MDMYILDTPLLESEANTKFHDSFLFLTEPCPPLPSPVLNSKGRPTRPWGKRQRKLLKHTKRVGSEKRRHADIGRERGGGVRRWRWDRDVDSVIMGGELLALFTLGI